MYNGLAFLDPDVELRANELAARPPDPKDARGAQAIAQQLLGRAAALWVALLGDRAGAVWAHAGPTCIAFSFTIDEGRIVAIDIVADPKRLSQFNPRILHEADGGSE